jgi:hypothetical protein
MFYVRPLPRYTLSASPSSSTVDEGGGGRSITITEYVNEGTVIPYTRYQGTGDYYRGLRLVSVRYRVTLLLLVNN